MHGRFGFILSGSHITMKYSRVTGIQWAVVVVFVVTASAADFDTTFSRADRFLKRHVCNGGVDYTAASKDKALDSILQEFADLSPIEFSKFSGHLRLAALINLYNLATIQLIVDNLPVTSIRKIDGAWSLKRISFGGRKVSLDEIEHTMIRKIFNEPLIHFALVCAARSCPVLHDGAYTSPGIMRQLKAAAGRFMSDPEKNRITGDTLELSEIFKWYGDDFSPRYGGVVPFIKKLRGLAGRNYTVRYLPYDWSLNRAVCAQ